MAARNNKHFVMCSDHGISCDLVVYFSSVLDLIIKVYILFYTMILVNNHFHQNDYLGSK